MKKLPYALLALSAVLLLAMCKKEKNEDPQKIDEILAPSCNATGYLNHQSTGFSFALPTAFTPNGDGKNDGYTAVANSANVTEYLIKVFDNATNTVVFQSTSMNIGWDGNSSTGYRHTVLIHFKDPNGNVVDTCSYIYKLSSNGTTCVNAVVADSSKYVFPDELDPANGLSVYQTSETFCH